VALSDLNLHVEPGEILGFLGPNGQGAGLVAGLIAPLMFYTAFGAAIASTVLDALSAQVYGSALAIAAAFGSIVLASVVVDRLTRARVERETGSLEFEG
jgi:iron complex transport system ATP-binding protein